MMTKVSTNWQAQKTEGTIRWRQTLGRPNPCLNTREPQTAVSAIRATKTSDITSSIEARKYGSQESAEAEDTSKTRRNRQQDPETDLFLKKNGYDQDRRDYDRTSQQKHNYSYASRNRRSRDKAIIPTKEPPTVAHDGQARPEVVALSKAKVDMSAKNQDVSIDTSDETESLRAQNVALRNQLEEKKAELSWYREKVNSMEPTNA